MVSEFSIGYDLNMPFVSMDGNKPAVFVTSAGDNSQFISPIRKIVRVITSLMNDHEPLGATENNSNRKVYFSQRGSDAFSLRTREIDGGVTEPGLVITINGALSEEQKEIVRKPFTPEFMSKLCGAIENPKKLNEHNVVSGAKPKM